MIVSFVRFFRFNFKKNQKLRKNKKAALVQDTFGKIIIGLLILIVILLGIFILSGKSSAAIDYIKKLFRFR